MLHVGLCRLVVGVRQPKGAVVVQRGLLGIEADGVLVVDPTLLGNTADSRQSQLPWPCFVRTSCPLLEASCAGRMARLHGMLCKML